MEKIFGFIGVGNMGGTLARSVCRHITGRRILLADTMRAKAQALADELRATAVERQAVAERADYIIIGVKPQGVEQLFEQIAPALAQRKKPFVLVSMAAGVTMDRIRSLAGADYPIIRIMPSMPCAVGEGVILCDCKDVDEASIDEFSEVMKDAGLLLPLGERLFDAGGAIASCGPAYVDLFLESLADAGVAGGLPREVALRIASQMVMGSAKLQLESGKHPGELKDAVCSPSGSTIQGVRTLEAHGFRSAVMEAVLVSCDKNSKLG